MQLFFPPSVFAGKSSAWRKEGTQLMLGLNNPTVRHAGCYAASYRQMHRAEISKYGKKTQQIYNKEKNFPPFSRARLCTEI